MRLLCSMGQHDSAVSYTIVSNKNYMHWYRIIVYSCMTCGFDRPHAIKCDVSHVRVYTPAHGQPSSCLCHQIEHRMRRVRGSRTPDTRVIIEKSEEATVSSPLPQC